MKTNNTAASLHALCVAANEIVADLSASIKSEAAYDYLQEDIDDCIERLENIDGYACDRINAGRPNMLVVRLTRGCKELLREFFGEVEDISYLSYGDELDVAIDSLRQNRARLEKEDFAGIEFEFERIDNEIAAIYSDIEMFKSIRDSYLTLCLA